MLQFTSSENTGSLQMKKYHYHTSCVNSTAPLIDAMVDAATTVTYRTFRQHCEGVDDWASGMGYDVGNEKGGLRLCNDWSVSFHRSKYNGRPCYYICHSCIEYIWVA